MLFSSKYAFLFLRLGLAAVFIWFGVDKLLHSNYWIMAWTSPALSLFNNFGISQNQLFSVAGIFEIIIGLSLTFSIFIKFFSSLAFFYLIAILVVNGLTEVTVRDIGLIGGFLTIIFWPDFRNRH